MSIVNKVLRQTRATNVIRRIVLASKYHNKRYLQIAKWAFDSKEDTNYTYFLTEANLKYLAQTISVVTDVSHEEVMRYIEEARNDDDLKNSILLAIDNSAAKKYADKEVRFGRRLGWYAFVRALKPKVVVETGVDKGLGSILLCAALLRNKEEGFDGYFYGTDINPNAGYILSGKYKEMGEILYGDSIESLAQFKDKIDLFINDSDHSAAYEAREYEIIKPLIGDHSVILGDNAHVTDKLADFSIAHGRKFLFFKEEPLDHWYPGAGIGISYKK